MSVLPWLVIVFFAVVATGPEFVERRARRRELRDRPLARVYYLPSACCRGGGPACPDPEHCAICLTRR